MGKTRLKLALGCLLLAGACAREEIAPARFDADDCRHLMLTDAVSGAEIVGAEDLALDRERGRLFISAYDRRAAEKAARQNKGAPPSGGLYVVGLDALFDATADSVAVSPLAAPADFAGGLRPHGVSYDAANHELVFINRAYARQGRKWKMTPELLRVGANGEAFVGAPTPAHCAANDVAANGEGVVTSFDHGKCGWSAGVENVFGLKRSGVASDDGGVYARARFANGVENAPDGGVIVAATREKAILSLKRGGDGYVEIARVKTPGGPDNLSLTDDGGIVAAVHPSLTKLALTRKYGIGRAPSRIVEADMATGAVDILVDDPKGKIFSAATSAVMTAKGLIAGSVTDKGLLICKAGE
ncbi:MAG: hypothetical protein R3C58_14105 [Parvularculaceae bacterium]